MPSESSERVFGRDTQFCYVLNLAGLITCYPTSLGTYTLLALVTD